jgi:hypothetical protein
MSFHRFLLISALAAGFATAALADEIGSVIGGQGTQAAQATTITRNFVFAPVTLSSSETARVIVVNTATAPTTTSSSNNDAAPSCTGKITFLASGATPPTVSAVSFTIGAGQFAFADLPYGKSGISTSPGEVVGKVESDLSVTSKAPCSLGMSLVVMDFTTGAAHVVLTNPSTQNNPLAFAFGNR